MESTVRDGGIGFLGLLTVVFITLKLTDHIDWSWWWVLSPLWLPTVLIMTPIILGFIIFYQRETAKEKKR